MSIDTETSGLYVDDGARVSAVSVAWIDAGEVKSFAWPFDQGMWSKGANVQTDLFGGTENPNLGVDEWEALQAWLAQRKLVMHNAKFDLHMLRAGTRWWRGIDHSGRVIWDTQLANRELWPLEVTSLKPTAVRLGLLGTGEEAKQQAAVQAALKAHKLGMGQFDRLEWHQVSEYSRIDAELTILLHARQIELFECDEGNWSLMTIEMDLMKVLYAMECRGVGYDVAGSRAAAAIIRGRMADIAAGLPFKPTPDGAKAYFFEKLGLTPAKYTNQGAPSLDEESLRPLVKQGIQGAVEWAEYGKLNRAVGMWYEGYADACGLDGRLRTNFRQAKVDDTKSGEIDTTQRLSVERVQLHAIPKDDKFDWAQKLDIPGIRDLIVAKDGCELWNLDLSQAELRVASRFADCRRMLDLLAQDADLHAITCERVLGAIPSDPDFKVKRDIAKRLNFGGIFQIGPKTFKETLKRLADIDITHAESVEYVKNWRDQYPEFTVAYQRHESMAKRNGWIRLQSGRRSWFGPKDWPNTAWSRRVQGSLAEFLKRWLIKADSWTAGRDMLLLTVHDSILLEIPELVRLVGLGVQPQEYAREIARLSAKLATDYFDIEMKVDVSPWRKALR